MIITGTPLRVNLKNSTTSPRGAQTWEERTMRSVALVCTLILGVSACGMVSSSYPDTDSTNRCVLGSGQLGHCTLEQVREGR
jgi:hypothetical protein